VNKGNYYKLKSRDWLRGKGYTVEIIEKVQRIFKDGKVIFAKRDLFGADLMACNETETILANSVLNRKNIASHIQQFHKFPGGGLKRWIVVWEPRVKEPEIIEITKEEEPDEKGL